jgi:hypothetical protein
VEVLFLAVVVVIAFSIVLGQILKSTERTVASIETVANKIADHLQNSVGGRPIALIQREFEVKDRQIALEERRAAVDIRIKEVGLEHEKARQDLELQHIRRMSGQSPMNDFDPEV